MLYAMFGPSKPRKRKEVTFHSPVITSGASGPGDLYALKGNSDTESMRAEAGTDDELDDPNFEEAKTEDKCEKMSSADESSDAAPEWTRDEDRIIFMRKSEGKSWAEIGKELERGRRECQQHYRMLRSHAKELGITTDNLAKLYIEEEEEKAKKDTKGKAKAKDDEKKEQGKGKDRAGKSKKDTTKSDSKSESKKKKNKKAVSETSTSDPDPESNSDTGSSSGDEEEDEEDPVAEYWAQRRYLYDTMYGQMFPDQKVLRADRFYSESDCRILAGLEARYRANKWLQIQADFANATGRMVEAWVLEAKFHEDEN